MRHATYLLSATMVALGLVILGVTLARGGGPIATGLVVGVLFVAAGVGRIYVERGRG